MLIFLRIPRKGGPLAVTDANLLLGRLIPDFFPKIFGKLEKEPLDAEASRNLFEKIAKEINESNANHLSLDEIVYGCVESISALKDLDSLTNYSHKVHQSSQRNNVPAYTSPD